MKRHLFNLLLLTALVVSLSACRTSVPRLDYKALARASVRLGVDIGYVKHKILPPLHSTHYQQLAV